MPGKMPMKLSQLLKARSQLVQRAALANSAYAYVLLSDFAGRIARAGLHGRVALKSSDPDNEQFWATLTTLTGNQSVIEEHFTDEDIVDLANAIAYITGELNVDATFELDEFAELYLVPLRAALEQAGVSIDREINAPETHTTHDSG